MKPGDIITTNNNQKYVLFSIDNEFIHVVDFETQTKADIISKDIIKEVENPYNVEFMFIKKRDKSLKEKGLDKFK